MKFPLLSSLLSLITCLPSLGWSQVSGESVLQSREERLPEVYQEAILPMISASAKGQFAGLPHGERKIFLHYKALISDQAKAGIVIVHGFGERTEKYFELAYDFYQQGYNVFLYDQRGHGASTRLLTENQAVHVEDFTDYVEDLRIFVSEVIPSHQGDKELFVFAHSMGGAVTSRFLVEYPGYFQAAVLSAPMHQIYLKGYPPWIAKTLAATADNLGLGKSYALGQSKPSPWPFEKSAARSRVRWDHYKQLSEKLIPEDQQTGGASYRWIRQAFIATDELLAHEKLAQLATPILLFQAGVDTWVEEQGQNEFCERVVACQLVRYDEAKHELYREPDESRATYLQSIFDFYKKYQSPLLSTKN
ncbi:MAG: alpha/beta fold hydrolase [Oligoflexus sp.]